MKKLPEIKVNKKIGGLERAKIAREELKLIFCNPKDPTFFYKDIDYAKKFDVTRHTIYKIRNDLKIASRSDRILAEIKKLKTKDITLKELSAKLNVKYQNLYKIVTDNKVSIRKE